MSQMSFDFVPYRSPLVGAQLPLVFRSLWSEYDLAAHSGYIIARLWTGVQLPRRGLTLWVRRRCKRLLGGRLSSNSYALAMNESERVDEIRRVVIRVDDHEQLVVRVEPS